MFERLKTLFEVIDELDDFCDSTRLCQDLQSWPVASHAHKLTLAALLMANPSQLKVAV